MKYLLLIMCAALIFISTQGRSMDVSDSIKQEKPIDAEYTILAGGCFWCIESEFRALDGVIYTEVGYIGGKSDSPTYRDITTGKTGHAEAIKIYYDPKVINLIQLYNFHLTKAHDPTQLNRQGVDIGTQYRSAIFYANEAQKILAEKAIQSAQRSWDKDIVTTLEPETHFWLGEDYHQQYYEKYEQTNGRPHARVIYKKLNRN